MALGKAADTRELILTTAERLFAEHGVSAVSNRRVGEAAGQGDNFAVGYHFGTKADLVRAIARRHAGPMDVLRERMLSRVEHSRAHGTEGECPMGNVIDDQPLSYPIAGGPAPLEPPAEWARLRQRCPVARVKLASGDEASLVTRYEDVKRVLADPRFTRPSAANEGARVSEDESGGVFNSEMATVLPQSGKAHQHWRRLLNRWFTAKRMTALRPGIEAMADELVDRMVAQGRRADLKAGLAFPLPVWVICSILGVPDSDREKFAYWSDTLLSMTRYTRDLRRVEGLLVGGLRELPVTW